MSTALNQTLCDLDAVPSILENIRLRSPSGPWFSQAEEWASKATNELEKLAVHYEDEKSEAVAYEEPEALRCLRSLDKRLDLLMGSEDLQELFMEKLGDLEMVELLLPFVDPSVDSNYAFRINSISGRLAVMDRLLADPRVDPSAYDNQSIRLASSNGHLAVVDRLLAARDASGKLCVDPSANDNEAIKMASKNGHVAVVERLLAARDASGRLCVDPSANNNQSFKMASANGHVAVVERLLADPRVDPSDQQNYALLVASYHGHVEVVKRLLADPRVDPSANNNEAIRLAHINGRQAVVELLKARGVTALFG